MLVRGLWGMEIEPSKNYIIVSNASFRISMATLNSFDDPGRTSVFIAFQDKEFKLCSLIPEKIEQQVIDITCLEGEKTVLRSEGPNCIHLTGNYVSLYDSDSEEESEDAGSDRKPGSEAGTITSNYTGEELIEENLSASEELGAVENENVEESFKMPIIYEYLDSLLQHDSTANAKFYNQQANVNSISQRNGRRTISTQKQESIEKDYSDTETSRSSEENDDTSTSTSDSEQNTKDIIVIPSEQTSDVESNDETSTTESDYKSCDEERRNEVEEIPYSEERIIIGKEKIEEIKDKDEGLEQIDGIKKIKEEQVEEPKALDLSYQIESESGDDNEESMNVDTKTDGKKSWPKMLDQKVNHDKSRSTIENNNALKKGNAKEKRTKVKVVIPIVERAKSPKSSSTPDVKSSNETIKTKVQKKKESVASAPTNAKANGNVKYDLAAPSNNNVKKVPTPNNNAKNDKASANKTAAKYPISQTSSRPSNRGGRKMAESSKTPTTPSKANGDKNSSQSKADDKSVTAQISTPQKGKDKDTQLKRRRALDDEKSTNEKSSVSRQSSVDTEIRYPKRKRAPDFERNLEFMAKEDAKMARRIGNHSAKRKKSPKTSSKSSQQ